MKQWGRIGFFWKKSGRKVFFLSVRESFQEFWCNNSIIFELIFKNCVFLARNGPETSHGWPFYEDLGVFFISVGRRVPFFGHSLLSYSKRRHLSTSRVIPLIDCHQSLYHQHWIRSAFFARPLFYMAEPYISILGLCPPYRILTIPYEPKMGPPCGRHFPPTSIGISMGYRMMS